jgi:hypothetical protein
VLGGGQKGRISDLRNAKLGILDGKEVPSAWYGRIDSIHNKRVTMTGLGAAIAFDFFAQV